MDEKELELYEIISIMSNHFSLATKKPDTHKRHQIFVCLRSFKRLF